jgi:hypothetical protein
MRNILFVAITALAVAFGNVAAASAALVGDGSNMTPLSTATPGYSVGTG